LLSFRVEQARGAERQAAADDTAPPRARVLQHARAYERFANAVLARNDLRQLADETQRRADNLQAKADLFESRGDTALRDALLAERIHHLALVPRLLASAERAEAAVAELRARLTADEEQLRYEIPNFGTLMTEARAERKVVRAAEAEQHARRQRPRGRFGRPKR
jgi:hypothetical protein